MARRKGYGPPVFTGMGGVEVYRAKVLSVNKTKWTAQVQSEFDNRVYTDVEIQPQYLTAAGGGQYHLPETNSLVYVCHTSTGSTPFILGAATPPSQLTGADDEDPSDRRSNRPVLNEGDILVAASDTSRIIVRRGGILEIGASETARTLYIPLQNLIKQFSQNWEHYSGGGSLRMNCRDNDETFGSSKTPAEFRLDWREFCEDTSPIIDLRMGRIKAEDDQVIQNAVRGEIVYRFDINRRHTIWIDKSGNSQIRKMGATYEVYNGPRREFHEQSLSHIVNQNLEGEYGRRSVSIAQYDSLTIGRDRTTRITGSLTEFVGAGIFRSISGAVEEETGAVRRTISGDLEESVLNNEDRTILGNQSISVGQSRQDTVGGTCRLLVANSNIDSVGWEVVVAAGKAVIHNTLGGLQFSVGPTQAIPTSSIEVNTAGTIAAKSVQGATVLELNASGANISTAAGAIAIDVTGTVDLGPNIGGSGYVVTTATHPFDLVTGAPIFGSQFVRASSGTNALGLPGPAVTPSGFLSDPTI